MARKEIRECEDVLAGKRKGMESPRYVTSPIRIDGPSFLARARWPGRQPEERPVFFMGYGHFGQVRQDVEKFPDYGVNMIQIEFGPRHVVVGENEFSDERLNDFLSVCDRAAKAGVTVNLLLSPHYFPSWALKKWPKLEECSGGFFKYCVHAPESRAILEKSLRRVIPRIKDHPAVHSLCLSNEPVNSHLDKCPHVRRMWHEWLGAKHKTIDVLNRKWRTEYPAFDAVPVPEAKFGSDPIHYDFTCFNQEQFAAFHRWMADIIHSIAPGMPVHAKIMVMAHFRRSLHGVWSVSPELFGALSQINGNDCSRWVQRDGEWTSNWWIENMGYDFQRSMADQPVFNSENHLIIDRDFRSVPPEFCHNVMWQGSIHGQSATTIWVWERTFNPTSGLAASIMHRPACAEAVGRACLDLNRLAPEVTALQRLKPQIAIFWSLASVVAGKEHDDAAIAAYQALNFLGLPIGFVTERQLKRFADGKDTPLPLRTAKVIVVPSAARVPAGALAGLRRFAEPGGKVLRIGDCFGFDAYGNPRDPGPAVGDSLSESIAEPDLLHAFEKRLSDYGIARRVRVVGPDGATAWGVEARAAEHEGAWLVNLTNHLREPQEVELLLDGKPVRGTDLLHNESLPKEFSVTPLVARLVRVPE